MTFVRNLLYCVTSLSFRIKLVLLLYSSTILSGCHSYSGTGPERSWLALHSSIIVEDSLPSNFPKSAHVISIGEMAHGTAEIAAMRRTIIRNLIRFHEYDCVLLEWPAPLTDKYEDYLEGISGDHINGLVGFANCQEFYETLRMLRQMNTQDHPLKIIGIDPLGDPDSCFRDSLTALFRDFDSTYTSTHSPFSSVSSAALEARACQYAADAVWNNRRILRLSLYARLNHQHEELNKLEPFYPPYTNYRDSSMAANIKFLTVAAGSGHKFIVLCHNAHAGKVEHQLGDFLNRIMPGSYAAIGLFAMRGSAPIFDQDDVLTPTLIPPPETGSIRDAIGSCRTPCFVPLNLAITDSNSWTDSKTKVLSVLAQKDEHNDGMLLEWINLRKTFDAVILLDSISPCVETKRN